MVEMHYLSAADVSRVPITYGEVASLVERALIEKTAGRTECPPKPGIHPQPNAFIHAMAAYVPAFGAAGMKWIGGFPENPANGLPYITGLIVLNDPLTGLPTTIMDCGRVTALRTAAVTAVAMKVLLPGASAGGRAAVIGCGVQGRHHLGMLDELFPDLAELRLFDVVPAAAHGARAASERQDRCTVVGSVRAAVDGAAVIITAVAERDEGEAGRIAREWLGDGVLMVPLANDFGWSVEAITAADRFFVDDRDQFEHFRSIGELERSTDVEEIVEFGHVVAGRMPGRVRSEERICSLNLGLAIHDIVVGDHVAQLARSLHYGQTLK